MPVEEDELGISWPPGKILPMVCVVAGGVDVRVAEGNWGRGSLVDDAKRELFCSFWALHPVYQLWYALWQVRRVEGQALVYGGCRAWDLFVALGDVLCILSMVCIVT